MEISLEKLLPISKILHVHKHWQSHIWKGLKTWELRNSPWQFTGLLGLWYDSKLYGTVKLTNCQLVALRGKSGEWEPYDCSPEAAAVFPLSREAFAKHQVAPQILKELAKAWNRMYAWELSDPCPFNESFPIQVKKGCQKIQSMQPEMWEALWASFHVAQAPPPPPSQRCQSESGEMSVIGIGLKEAFDILEGDASLLIKTYNTKTTGTLHVAVVMPKAKVANIVGKFNLVKVEPLEKMDDLRHLEKDGYKHNLTSKSLPMEQLRSGKKMYAFIIDSKQLLEPPLTWPLEPLLNQRRCICFCSTNFCFDVATIVKIVDRI